MSDHGTTAPTCTDLAFLPGLSATTRLVLIALAAEPHTPTGKLADRLHVPESTVRRALAAAEVAGVIRRGPSTTTERGPILWTAMSEGGAPRSPSPAEGGAPRSPSPAEGAHHAPPGGAPRSPSPTKRRGEASLSEEGQAQGQPNPPHPPIVSALPLFDTTPNPEPPPTVVSPQQVMAQRVRAAVSHVRQARRDRGLATGIRYDGDIARVLAQLVAEGHALEDVTEAAGRSLVVSVASVVVALNDGKVSRPSAKRVPRASVMAAAGEHAALAAEWVDPTLEPGWGANARVRP